MLVSFLNGPLIKPWIWITVSKTTGQHQRITTHQVSPRSLVNISLDSGAEEGERNEDIGQLAARSNNDGDLLSMAASIGTDNNQDDLSDKIYDLADSMLSHEWHMKLDEANRYSLNWQVEYARNEITFTVRISNGTGALNFRQAGDIFALGFSQNEQLASSDFCIIWSDLGHRIHLQDARTDAENRLQLIPAERSHCKLLHLADNRDDDGAQNSFKNQEEFGQVKDREKNGEMEIVFRRPLDVCDSNDENPYYRIDNGTSHLVWFTVKGPQTSIDGLRLSPAAKLNHHENSDSSSIGNQWLEFGLRRVQLVATRAKVVDPNGGSEQPSTRSLDIRMDHFKIPAKETTYWCKLFKLPRKFESRKYHITSYEAAISEGNEHIVHHMELFNCANLSPSQSAELDSLHDSGGWSGDCSGAGRPTATAPCKRVVLAWAMGARPLVYPAPVGQSLGGRHYSPFMLLEVHYNNAASSAGLVDSSGLRFHYTSRLRPFDAGVLEVGLEYSDRNSIPPRMVTPLVGYCVGECTRTAMGGGGKPEQEGGGIHIFAGQMHTHLAGVASWTEIIRGGRVVRELQRDDHYSPHFQEIRLLPEPIHLAPGDALAHYCVYDTRSRDNITLGGFSTSDEMCVAYLHYYPKLERLEVCKSSVDSEALESYFAYLAREEAQPTSERLPVGSSAENDVSRNSTSDQENRKSVAENYRSIRWSRRRSKELIEFYSDAPLSVQCQESNGDSLPGQWTGVQAPRATGSWGEQLKPFELRLPDAEQLVAYRGQGARSRHAQCSRELAARRPKRAASSMAH